MDWEFILWYWFYFLVRTEGIFCGYILSNGFFYFAICSGTTTIYKNSIGIIRNYLYVIVWQSIVRPLVVRQPILQSSFHCATKLRRKSLISHTSHFWKKHAIFSLAGLNFLLFHWLFYAVILWVEMFAMCCTACAKLPSCWSILYKTSRLFRLRAGSNL